jgi:hypothetical protein
VADRTIHKIIRTMKVTRTTHEIRVWPGLVARALAQALQDLPPMASLREVQEESNDITVLEFVQETER